LIQKIIYQFFNPSIIWKYNALQAVYGGHFSINPKDYVKAYRSVINKDETYLEFDRYGLYQKQDLIDKRTIQQEIEKYSKITLERHNKFFKEKLIENLQEQLGWSLPEIKKLLQDKKFLDAITKTLVVPSNVMGNATWIGDEIQRTVSAQTLVKQGKTPQEAAQEAARNHGGYSLVGTKYKQVMRYLAFVYSFRMLMPWNWQIKPTAILISEAYKKATGKKTDPKKAKRAAKVLATTMALPLGVDILLRAEGWEDVMEEEESDIRKALDPFVIEIGKDGKYGKFRNYFPQWKYGKNITLPDGTEKQIVLSLGLILNMISKGVVRSTVPTPASDNVPLDRAVSYLQWEVHPSHKHLLHYLYNEPMFGEEKPRGFDGTDWGTGFLWALKKSFIAYDKDMWLEQLGLLEKDETDIALDANLNSLEKIISTFGYTYVTSTPQDKIKKWKKDFKKIVIDEMFNIKFQKGLTAEQVQKRKKELKNRLNKFLEEMERLEKKYQ
jgi:hypothetical protein